MDVFVVDVFHLEVGMGEGFSACLASAVLTPGQGSSTVQGSAACEQQSVARPAARSARIQ